MKEMLLLPFLSIPRGSLFPTGTVGDARSRGCQHSWECRGGGIEANHLFPSAWSIVTSDFFFFFFWVRVTWTVFPGIQPKDFCLFLGFTTLLLVVCSLVLSVISSCVLCVSRRCWVTLLWCSVVAEVSGSTGCRHPVHTLSPVHGAGSQCILNLYNIKVGM